MENNAAINQEFILTKYVDYLLSHGERPKNVFLFAKENGFEEREFYVYFSSFEHAEKQIINHFFEKSVELLEEETALNTTKEKLLHVYFVFFENLTLNRSIVLQILGDYKFKNRKILDTLKVSFFSFLDTLDFKQWKGMEQMNKNIAQFSDKSRKGAMWLHLLSVLDFWKADQSPDFEKTDIYIEKTIDTGFELIENTPLKKVLDLGRFLWKERI